MMLFFRLFHEYMGSIPGGRPDLASVCELLSHTSQFITIMRGRTAIRSADDIRLTQLKKILQFFKSWEDAEKTCPQHLMSVECRKDLACSILGFISYVENVLCDFPTAEIIPATVNTDLLENMFGCQRCLIAGTGTNPTVNQYCHTINTITLTTSSNTVPKKTNAGNIAVPFQFQEGNESTSILKRK